MFKTKKIIIAGSIILSAGIILMAIGFAFGGFKIREMNGIVFTPKEYTPASEIQSFILEDRNTPVEVRRSADNRLRVKYYESKYDVYNISEENGVLSFRKDSVDSRVKFLYNMFDFSSKHTLTLFLPEETIDLLDIETTNSKLTADEINGEELMFKSTNGKITLDDVRAESIDARTTNGKIDLENITAAGAIRLRTTNGSVSCEELSAASVDITTTNAVMSLDDFEIDGEINLKSTNGRLELSEMRSLSIKAQTSNSRIVAEDLTTASNITLKTTNGRIEFSNIRYTELFRCETKNGSVRGRLPGELADYSVKSRTTNSSNNLPENLQLGELQLEVETTNGKIDVSFVGTRNFDDD